MKVEHTQTHMEMNDDEVEKERQIEKRDEICDVM